MTNAVETAIADAFPEREVESVAEAGLSWNDANETVRVEFADGDAAFLKAAVDGDGTRAAREAAVLEHVAAHTDTLVPDVLASDPAGDTPYLATVAVDATPGWRAWRDADDDERAALARALGRTLAGVHACRFDVHGQIRQGCVDGSADALPIDAAPWPSVLVETIESTREQADDGRFDHHFDDVLAVVDDHRDRLRDVPAALLHGDPARPNAVLVDADDPDDPDGSGPASADVQGPTVGLLDWELAHVGDPVRELQRAKRQFLRSMYDPGTDRHVQAFYDGYRARAGKLPEGFEDRRRLYDAVTYLGVSGFFERWAPDMDRPTDELAVEVRDEMARRLDAARR